MSQVCCDASPSCCTSCRGRECLLPRTNRTHITPKSPTLAWKTRGRKSPPRRGRAKLTAVLFLSRAVPRPPWVAAWAPSTFRTPSGCGRPPAASGATRPTGSVTRPSLTAVWGAALYFTFKWSSANERCYLPPVDYPIPSQFWRKHAVEDDPRLKDMGWEQVTNTPAGTKR